MRFRKPFNDQGQIPNCPIKALRDNVVLEVPEFSKINPEVVIGTVSSVGPDVKDPELSITMSVVVPQIPLAVYTFGGKRYIIIPFSEIRGAFRHGATEDGK